MFNGLTNNRVEWRKLADVHEAKLKAIEDARKKAEGIVDPPPESKFKLLILLFFCHRNSSTQCLSVIFNLSLIHSPLVNQLKVGNQKPAQYVSLLKATHRWKRKPTSLSLKQTMKLYSANGGRPQARTLITYVNMFNMTQGKT